METYEFIGKNVREATEKALIKLSLDIDDLDIEIIDSGSKGFLGFGSKDAKIKVTIINNEQFELSKSIKAKEIKEEPKTEEIKTEEPKTEEIKAEESKTEEIKTEEPKTEEILMKQSINIEAQKKIATEFLTQLFDSMGMKINMKVSAREKQIYITLTGEKLSIIIGKRGQTLDSLQYLVNLIVNKGDAPYIGVIIDAENYRQRRRETLEALAFSLAKKARTTGEIVVVEPMSAYERRIMHFALQNHKYVTTYSEGVEPYRNVVIKPKGK